jgi:hypothetical protein
LDPERKEKALEWIAWAKGYVERMDPLKRGFGIAEVGKSDSQCPDQDPDETA